MITRNVFITGLIVLAATAFLFSTYPAYEPPARYTPPKGTPAPADGAVGAGDFELFLAALGWRENEEGDPNKVCEDGCGCVGLYQITEIYVDDVNSMMQCFIDEWAQWVSDGNDTDVRVAAPVVFNNKVIYQFTYEDRKDPELAGVMVNLYLQHYVVDRMVYYDWSTLARVHHGGPDGWRKEYTWEFGEDVVVRMEKLKGDNFEF